MANIIRKQQRLLRRAIKTAQYRARGNGEREQARRVSQMVNEQLKPDNGVVQEFEANPMPILQCDSCGDDLSQDQSGLCDTCIELLDKEDSNG